jgi:hypothetical protein
MATNFTCIKLCHRTNYCAAFLFVQICTKNALPGMGKAKSGVFIIVKWGWVKNEVGLPS